MSGKHTTECSLTKIHRFALANLFKKTFSFYGGYSVLLHLLITSNVISYLLQFESITSLNTEHMKAIWVLQFIVYNNLSLVKSRCRFYKCFFNCRQIYYEAFLNEHQAVPKIYLAYRAVNHDPLKYHKTIIFISIQAAL